MSAAWLRLPSFSSTATRDAHVYNARDIGQWVTVTGTPPTYYLITSVSSAGVATFSQIGGAPVTSVFGRIGIVVATLGDYAASLITNDSSWAGATVKDALNTIFAGSVFSFNGRVGTVTPADGDYDEFNVGAPSSISTARTVAANRNVIIDTPLTLSAGGSLTCPAGSSVTQLAAPADTAFLILNESDVLAFPEVLCYFDGDHVGLTSSKVSTWTDRSPKGNSGTQVTAGKRPVVFTAALNGNSTLKFAGAECIQVPNLSVSTFTEFVVCQNMTDAVKIIAEHGDGTTRGHFLTSGSSGDSILVRRGVVSSKNVTSWAAGLEPLIICHFFFGTHVQHMVWLRGNALTAHTAGGSGTSDPGTSSTTQTLNIGSRNNAASLLLTGEIASYALFSPALSPSRMMAVAHMLSRKYGCAVA